MTSLKKNDVPELVRYSGKDICSDLYFCREVKSNEQGEYVLHSQATAIIALKDTEIASLKYIYGSATRSLEKIKGKLKAAEAENAALTARVKRLEHKERFWLDKNDALEAKLAAAVKALDATHEAISEYYRYHTGGEMRGSYDGKQERNALWKSMYQARATLKAEKQP